MTTYLPTYLSRYLATHALVNAYLCVSWAGLGWTGSRTPPDAQQPQQQQQHNNHNHNEVNSSTGANEPVEIGRPVPFSPCRIVHAGSGVTAPGWLHSLQAAPGSRISLRLFEHRSYSKAQNGGDSNSGFLGVRRANGGGPFLSLTHSLSLCSLSALSRYLRYLLIHGSLQLHIWDNSSIPCPSSPSPRQPASLSLYISLALPHFTHCCRGMAAPL